jgi:enolase
MENPKALLDTDQLIEYYFKLANDKPLISYYEDPVFTEDLVAWGKLLVCGL